MKNPLLSYSVSDPGGDPGCGPSVSQEDKHLTVYIFFDFKCYTGIGFGYCQVLVIQKDKVLWIVAAPFMIKIYTTTSQEAKISWS